MPLLRMNLVEILWLVFINFATKCFPRWQQYFFFMIIFAVRFQVRNNNYSLPKQELIALKIYWNYSPAAVIGPFHSLDIEKSKGEIKGPNNCSGTIGSESFYCLTMNVYVCVLPFWMWPYEFYRYECTHMNVPILHRQALPQPLGNFLFLKLPDLISSSIIWEHLWFW